MTTVLWHFAAVVAVVFLINLLPAFGPPTWVVLVLFKLDWHLNPVALVLLGAIAAGSGRYVLATATGRLRGHLSPRRKESLQAASGYLTGHKGRSVLALALFTLSPLPSAQLFEAAGLMAVPLLPVTAAFFAGRLVSYSLYIGAASIAEKNLGTAFTASLTSPYAIAIQVGLLLAVVLLARVDWVKVLRRRTKDRDP
jgi:membrane protein YqaA with SNARE-associated domain